MKNNYWLRIIFLLLSSVISYGSEESRLFLRDNDRCSTIAVGPKAGVDGPMNTHTADCSDCDFRINKVPSSDWTEGSPRPLYLYKGNYPATVTSSRGSTWHPKNLEGSKEQLEQWGLESIITGYIPQVQNFFY
jgi:hypothetical protein